jgi:hypothetical protein
MAYDEGLAERLRESLSDHPEMSEKKMFGGLSFLLNGNLCVGVIGDEMIARVGPDAYPAALAQSHTRAFDFTGRPMTGWVVVSPDGLDSDESLQEWVDRALNFVMSLPPK